jgi:flagellar biosynthesis/type III secretory pathway M-ring protein FliF/YscJ
MSEEKDTNEKETNEKDTKTIWQNPQVRKGVIYAAVLIVVFLLGLIPMWLTASERGARLAETQRELKIAQMHDTIASAVIDARRAEYEAARQSASNFFTNLRAEMERENDSVLTEAQRESVRPLFTQRDEIITLLSRGDPVSGDRLSNFYISYRKAIGGSSEPQ